MPADSTISEMGVVLVGIIGDPATIREPKLDYYMGIVLVGILGDWKFCFVGPNNLFLGYLLCQFFFSLLFDTVV
jgi:hypothetical protein